MLHFSPSLLALIALVVFLASPSLQQTPPQDQVPVTKQSLGPRAANMHNGTIPTGNGTYPRGRSSNSASKQRYCPINFSPSFSANGCKWWCGFFRYPYFYWYQYRCSCCKY
eukprot:GFUD01011316.1.p1 GENE.GFUD01011316.1~~GFUD01011316.1.p1  ORF type:complete len:129 (+),score=17.86 GFUD01011316.1:57-389(+)